jgi:hypothetical protein
MRPDPARPSSSFGRRGGMASHIARAIVLFVGLAGCGPQVGGGVFNLNSLCLEESPGDLSCCYPGDHIDNGLCCDPGYHAVTDVEHADWKTCVLDENPADAGADTPLDAGTDAP